MPQSVRARLRLSSGQSRERTIRGERQGVDEHSRQSSHPRERIHDPVISVERKEERRGRAPASLRDEGCHGAHPVGRRSTGGWTKEREREDRPGMKRRRHEIDEEGGRVLTLQGETNDDGLERV